MDLFEFGIAVIDVKSLTVVRSGQYYVKNERYEVSDFCTQFTGITQQKLDEQGSPLTTVSEHLINEWNTKRRANMVCSWRAEADWMLKDYQQKELMAYYPFSNHILNLAHYYRFGFGRKRSGLKSVANYYDVEICQPSHTAQADVISLANVLIAMIKRGDIWPYLNKE